ncbi:DUF5133 domain-containing protein [Streptomyces sp. NPDC005141]
MLMPLPGTLDRLVEEYETLLAAETLTGATVASPRLRDIAYTLCVSTGTREITDALESARSYLAEAGTVPPPSGPPASGEWAARSGTVEAVESEASGDERAFCDRLPAHEA